MEFHRDNHFVPQSYLKRWADSDGKVWSYRTLVSHPKVPFWKPVSLKGIAYHQHLYTRIVGGKETDEIERWLDREFENPAEEALRKATDDERMSRSDYRTLIRFLAAQDVRTPARMFEILSRADGSLQETMNESLRESKRKLKELHHSGKPIPTHRDENTEFFPSRVHIERGEEESLVRLELHIGRKLWHFHLRRLLTSTLAALCEHRWQIVRAPPGMYWMTSDDPVIKLNFNSPTDYDFNGGWGSPKTDIFMPLGPKHLLITEVGERARQPRGAVLPEEKSRFLQRCIVEHAHRRVFALSPDQEVERTRPRIVDQRQFEKEKQQWKRWHEEQKLVELQFSRKNRK